MLKNLLQGKNPRAQSRLDELFETIGKNPRLAWYPSACNDYRDLLELTPERAKLHGIQELPDLFIHSDYYVRSLHQHGIAHSDENTTVRIEDHFEIQLTQKIRYHVSPRFAGYPEAAPREPTIYLLDVAIRSDVLGEVRKPVLYFLFENINFLDEFVLRNNIPITFFVKVRDGFSCGGGNRKSTSLVYAFLSALKTKYLLVDTAEQTDFELINELKTKHNLQPADYDLLKTDTFRWSGYDVSAYSVTYAEGELTDEKLKTHLAKISVIPERTPLKG